MALTPIVLRGPDTSEAARLPFTAHDQNITALLERIALAAQSGALADPTVWMMGNGNSGTNYGFREDMYGAMADPIVLGTGGRCKSLYAISPGTIRFELTDGNVNIQSGLDDALRVTFRDLNGANIAVELLWNAANARYENTNAAAVYTWLAARGGQLLQVKGLNTDITPSGLTIAGTLPATMTIGQAYDFGVTVSGGTAPYTFSRTGTWMPGITLNTDTGASSGTVGGTAQTYNNLSITVTDALGATASLTPANIAVQAAGAALAITGSPVTTGTEGQAYGGFVPSVSGGATPYTLSLVGDYPEGIVIGPAGKAVVGDKINEAGTFTGLSVRATDALGATADMTAFTLTVAPQFGSDLWTATNNGGNPTLGATIAGDSVMAWAFKTDSTVPPVLAADAGNGGTWVLVEAYVGINTAGALYKLTATGTLHTCSWTGASGRRFAKAWRGKVFDIHEFASFGTGIKTLNYSEL